MTSAADVILVPGDRTNEAPSRNTCVSITTKIC